LTDIDAKSDSCRISAFHTSMQMETHGSSKRTVDGKFDVELLDHLGRGLAQRALGCRLAPRFQCVQIEARRTPLACIETLPQLIGIPPALNLAATARRFSAVPFIAR
jgi:hypothetical protein